MTPKARGKLAFRYCREIEDDTGRTTQYLEPLPDGQWLGWEVYEDGFVSAKQTFRMDVLPLGYRSVDDE